MLNCIECGCSSDERSKGWAAYRCDEPDPDEPDDGGPAVSFYCPDCARREFGHRSRFVPASAGRPELEPAQAFSVTMVRPGIVPSFEVGAYEYFGRGLPLVGETILMRRTHEPGVGEVSQGYVTRVNPSSDTPIAVTEVVPAVARE